MRIDQLLKEQRLDEKPMGILSKAGNTIMSKLGSGKAGGKLKTGDLANKIHKEYDDYLGQTGEEPSAENIVAFLKFKKYPTQSVSAYLASPEAQNQAPAGPGEAPTKAATAAPAEPVEPTLDAEPQAAAPTAAPAAKTAPSFNNQLAGGKQSVNVGGKFDPATMQNTPGTPAPTGVPTATKAQTAPAEEPAANPNGYNGKTGAAIPATAPNKDDRAAIQAARSAARATTGGAFDSQTGEPIDLKTQIKNRLGKPNTNFKGYQAAAKAKGIQNASKSFAGKSRISEAVSSKVIDKAILIAAQDAARMGIGAEIGGAAPPAGAPAGPAGTAPSAAPGGFMAGLKQGMGGKAAAPASTVTLDQVMKLATQLSPEDQTKLITTLQSAPTESRKSSGTKLAESRQTYSIFKK